MQITLHQSEQETATGNSDIVIEPELLARSLVINVSQISVNLLGSITFKAQHSSDGTNWFDIPSLSTGAISSTGNTLVSVSPSVAILNHIRVSWTFSNANSATFVATLLTNRS